MTLTAISDRGLVRLIPSTFHKPPSLRGLVDDEDEFDILAQIEGLTSGRLMAERGRNLHIDRRELAWQRRERDLLVYGNTHINAAFAYTRKGGNRFNDENRGAWYCSWDSLTSLAEVGFHKTRELTFIGRYHDSTRYVELLADFIDSFPEVEPPAPALHPDPEIGYPAGQALAESTRRAGHSGLIYPSVRHPSGKCLVVFEPSAIRNVRPGAQWDLIWDGSESFRIQGVEGA